MIDEQDYEGMRKSIAKERRKIVHKLRKEHEWRPIDIAKLFEINPATVTQMVNKRENEIRLENIDGRNRQG